MSRYRHLPIWKAAMQLAVHLEQAVKRLMQAIPGLPASRNLRLSKFAPGEFVSRYHKYTLGSERLLLWQPAGAGSFLSPTFFTASCRGAS